MNARTAHWKLFINFLKALHKNSEMRHSISLAMVLVLLRVPAGDANRGYCADGKCFSIHTDRASFFTADHACRERGGHLMTVRTERTSDVLSDLLKTFPGDFWIGLRYTGDRCSDSVLALKGYKWVTGDDATQYANWKSDDAVCSPRCVSVSKSALKWNERPCHESTEGYLCEYKNTDYCPPLGTDAVYATPFGFTSTDLQQIPQGTNGTARPSGTRYICLESWIKAPWSCEVFGGGCEHECVRREPGYACVCPPGFTIDNNGVTCTRQDDPCAGLGNMCVCGPGFELDTDGKTCKDINECTDESACPGANSVCVNTAGGFECRCRPGFENQDGGCVDVNECESAPCEHECINTPGSYYCECYEGHIQSTEDMHKCKMHCPVYECPADCDPNNSAQCNCPDGFLLEDEQRCVDIDECDSGQCAHSCENTPGGFKCSCDEGFTLFENVKCVTDDLEGSGTSTPFDSFFPTSRSPTDRPVSLSAGGLLGIMIVAVGSVLMLVCLAHYVIRRKMHHYDVHKSHHNIYDFQQVIVDKNTQLSFPNRYIKRDT